jgi:hypothetical protein
MYEETGSISTRPTSPQRLIPCSRRAKSAARLNDPLVTPPAPLVSTARTTVMQEDRHQLHPPEGGLCRSLHPRRKE